MKTKNAGWEKIVTSNTFNKELIFKLGKEFIQLNSKISKKQKTPPIKNSAKELKTFS